jgi:hypothetical protein
LPTALNPALVCERGLIFPERVHCRLESRIISALVPVVRAKTDSHFIPIADQEANDEAAKWWAELSCDERIAVELRALGLERQDQEGHLNAGGDRQTTISQKDALRATEAANLARDELRKAVTESLADIREHNEACLLAAWAARRRRG